MIIETTVKLLRNGNVVGEIYQRTEDDRAKGDAFHWRSLDEQTNFIVAYAYIDGEIFLIVDDLAKEALEEVKGRIFTF